MNTLLNRLKSETPKFWKKALKLGLALSSISVALLSDVDGAYVPEIIRTIAGYLATAGFVLTAVAKATTTDAKLSEK